MGTEIVHRKRTFKKCSQTGGIGKRHLYVLVKTKDILKTESFENDDAMIKNLHDNERLTLPLLGCTRVFPIVFTFQNLCKSFYR